MKTIIILMAIIFLFIAGCEERKGQSSPDEHGSTSTFQKTEQTEDHSNTSLTLNDGKKWELDEPTGTNMNAAKKVFQQSMQASKQDYTTLAVNLQDNANKLVSECRMSGKDHDMLHVWLEKYLSTLKELKAPDTATQKTAFNKIGEQLKSFDQYFE